MNHIEMTSPKENWQKIVAEMSKGINEGKYFEDIEPRIQHTIPYNTNRIDPTSLLSDEMTGKNINKNKHQFPSGRQNNVVYSLTRTTCPPSNHCITQNRSNPCNKSILSMAAHKKSNHRYTTRSSYSRDNQTFKTLPNSKRNCEVKHSSESLEEQSMNSPLPPKLVLNLGNGRATTYQKCCSRDIKASIFERNPPINNNVSNIELGRINRIDQSNRTPTWIPENSEFPRPVSTLPAPPIGPYLDRTTPHHADSYYERSEVDGMFVDSETPSLFLDENFVRKMRKSEKKRKTRRKKRNSLLYGRSTAFRQLQLYQINGKRTQKVSNRKGVTKRSTTDEISANFILALCTLLCCCPLGVVSMFYMYKVKKDLAKNDREGARESSLAGRKVGNTGIKIGITGLAMALILFIVKSNLPYANSTFEYDYYLPEYESG